MKRVLVLGALLVLCAGCGATKQVVISPKAAPASAGVVLNPPQRTPSFLLRDQDAKLVGPQQFRGHWTIVTFLYTHCPDVCPLVANQLAAAQRQNVDLRVIAVSVDPKRDTPAAVKHFIAEHRLGPRFRYTTGTPAALSHVWALYHVASLPGPKGTITHSTFEILIDPQGRERVYFDAKVTARAVLNDLKA